MQNFRRKRNLNKYIRLIALALVLRSFIAPGFMLDTSSGNGLAIIFCNGPAGLYVPANDHANHHAHYGTDDGPPHQNHITPACSHWSTSSMLVFNSYVAVNLPDTDRTHTVPLYDAPVFAECPASNRLTRGPPARC